MARKILVLNGNDGERLLLSGMLSEGFDVIEASAYEDALYHLRRNALIFSAVVIDASPRSGEETNLLQRIREHAVWNQIPAIATLHESDPAAEERAYALGAGVCLTPPFRPQLTLLAVRNAVTMHERAAISNAIHRDRLTGIDNRETFFSKAEKLIRSSVPGEYVLSCFDVDSFKVINDQYGMEKGDAVLKHIAETISAGMDEVDGICCRIMADKFALLFPTRFLRSDAIEATHERASSPKCLSRKIRMRIGRYIVNDPSLPVVAMFDRATLAEESIKGRYDRYIAEYNERMREKLLREQNIVNDMSEALMLGQFETWFQPQYNHATGALIGAEALIRWRDPKSGKLVPPGEFIPVFERNGFIYELDKYTWEQACIMLRREFDAGYTPLSISVNISRYDVYHDDFMDVLTGLVARYSIPPEYLHLEITESAFANAQGSVIEKIKKLIELGYTVEIDDFGSGYSSLNTLKDVPATVLKLDMGFLENRSDTVRSGTILESIVRMAKWLGMTVIAEGVETREQADYLKSIGCNFIQGYFYARPMPQHEYITLSHCSMIEAKKNKLETVETLDNSAFWDPKSMDTLIFNSYVSGACILERRLGRIEVIRQNERYTRIFESGSINGVPLSEIPPDDCLDSENSKIMYSNIDRAIETRRESTCELVIYGLDGDEHELHLINTVRALAMTEDRCLLYSVVHNVTSERMSQKKERRLAERLQAILANTDSGITAVVATDEEHIEDVLINDRFYDMLGYTREQYMKESDGSYACMLEEDAQRLMPVIHDLDAVGKSATMEFRAKRRDGRVIWLHAVISVIRLGDIASPVQLSSFTDITAAREVAAALSEATRHLRFLSDVAHDLLIEPDTERGINGTLSRLLTYFEGDRAYIVEFNTHRGVASNTYEAVRDGVRPLLSSLGAMPMKAFSVCIDEFERNGFLFMDTEAATGATGATGAAGAEKRRVLETRGTDSLTAIPLVRDGGTLGYLAIDGGKNKRALIHDLIAVGDYIAMMLSRRDLRRKISSDNETLTTLMNDIPGGFVRMKVLREGGTVPVYINEGFYKLIGITRENFKRIYGNDAYGGVHPDDIETVREAEMEMLLRGEARSPAYRLLNGGGGYTRVMFFGRRTKDASGNNFFNVFYTEAGSSRG